MNSQDVLAGCLDRMPSDVRHAILRAVYFQIDGHWRFAAARLVFTSTAEPAERHDHGALLFSSRTLPAATARLAVAQIMHQKSAELLGLEETPKFSSSPDVGGSPESLPVRFGQRPRLNEWPEFRFSFRSEYSM